MGLLEKLAEITDGGLEKTAEEEIFVNAVIDELEKLGFGKEAGLGGMKAALGNMFAKGKTIFKGAPRVKAQIATPKLDKLLKQRYGEAAATLNLKAKKLAKGKALPASAWKSTMEGPRVLR